MSRVIGIDYGLVRTGVSVTDPLQLIATPLQTVSTYEVIDFLKNYMTEKNVEAIVVGYPLPLAGGTSSSIYRVSKFTKQLSKAFGGIAIFTFDERFTSNMAQASLLEGGFSKKTRKNKSKIDAMSATFILRSFLTNYAKNRITS